MFCDYETTMPIQPVRIYCGICNEQFITVDPSSVGWFSDKFVVCSNCSLRQRIDIPHAVFDVRGA